MTDSKGRLVDFSNTVIVLTSNLGARELAQAGRKRVGFSDQETPSEGTGEVLTTAAKKALPPELYNRIDEVLPFAPLGRNDVLRIASKLCQGLSDELELSRGVRLRIDETALSVLLESGGFEPEFGARPLRRTMARLLEAPLSEMILAGELLAGHTCSVRGRAGQLGFDVTVEASAAE